MDLIPLPLILLYPTSGVLSNAANSSIFFLTISVLTAKSGTRITKAIFCIYDIIFHRDIRVEVCFPGTMSTYSIDDALKKDSVSDLEWNCAFVSSVVRSFYPYSGNAVCIFPPLETKELYDAFLKAATIVIRKGTTLIKYIDFRLGTTHDVLETTPNDLAGEIINFLIRNCLYEECCNFIKLCIFN